MKCPICQAKLLPVDGELFCLQCGRSQHLAPDSSGDDLQLEDTQDPMLQRAIRDAGNIDTLFSAPEPEPEPVKLVAPPKPAKMIAAPKEVTRKAKAHTASFMSLHSVLASPKPLDGSGMLLSVREMHALSKGPAPTVPAGRHSMAARQHKASAKAKGVRRGWVTALSVLVVFAGLNLVIGQYYSNRIYPGVKVGSLEVGGWTFAELEDRLSTVIGQTNLSAQVDGREYRLSVGDTAAASQEKVAREAEQTGRGALLPVSGAIGSWLADPVRPSYSLAEIAVNQAVDQLAAQVDRPASNAFMTIIGKDVFVVADHPGIKLDKSGSAAAIRSAYGRTAEAALTTIKEPARVMAADWSAEVTAAQAVIGQSLQITVKKTKYAPTAEQIASWLIFSAPGKGVGVDPAGVAAYVASIPGLFDRKAAVDGLIAGLASRQPVVLSAALKPVTDTPKLASIVTKWPLMTYSYCIAKDSAATDELLDAAKKTLGSGGGWTLGGRIAYVYAKTGCNFTLQANDANSLASLDPACEQQTTCRIHNDLAINIQNWLAPPVWTGGAPVYRSELINQVVGQWLGFNHSSCKDTGQVKVPMAAPAVTVAGCSPLWYPVPAEIQDTLVLDGF